jgi:predicted TIM-barrel fold metal-dependent hydrolase
MAMRRVWPKKSLQWLLLAQSRHYHYETVATGYMLFFRPEALMKISVSMLAPLLWVASGTAQNQLPIIDMHLHATGVSSFGGPMTVCTNEQNVHFPGLDPHDPITVERAQVCDTRLPSASTDAELIADTIEMLDRYNIYAVTDGTLDELDQWRAASPARIIPAMDFEIVGGPSPDEFRRLFHDGKFQVFAEVSPQYDGKLATDDALDDYFALAEELDIPIGIHVGEGPVGGAHVLGYSGYKAALSSALQLEDVILKYPKLRLYVMHYGSPLVEDTIALLYSHPQVYVDIAQNNWGFPRAHFYRQLKMLIDAGFQTRIMFGSDQMIWPETIRIAIETVEGADFLSDEQKRDIFYNNAARFLRLTDGQIASHHRH